MGNVRLPVETTRQYCIAQFNISDCCYTGTPFQSTPSPSFLSDENCPLCLEMMALFHDLAEKKKSKQTF